MNDHGTLKPIGLRDRLCRVLVLLSLGVIALGCLAEILKAADRSEKMRAGDDWWSLQPIRRPAVPPFQSDARIENPIDVFVEKRRSEAGLAASNPATKQALIRRLYYDLHGLPPSPDVVDRFEDDTSPRAYEQWVDRILAGPQFGERWARHWLDVARFGESQGFERDHLRLHSWRYRDWVVNALNQNLPYDEFAQMQLAGDVMFPNRPEGVVATGFLVAGAYDIVGQTQQSAAMRAVVRQDEMEDYVSTVGQAFLGLTVHCARCHDHKFDPILQREYYQLSAALAGVRPGDRKVSAVPNEKRYDARIRDLDEKLRELAEPVERAILAERRKALPVPSEAMPLFRFASQSLSESGGHRIDGAEELREKTIQVRLEREDEISLRQRVVTFVQSDGSPKEILWLGKGGRVELSYEGGERTHVGTVKRSASGEIFFTIVFQNGGKVWLFDQGQAVGAPLAWRSPVTYLKGAYALQIGEAPAQDGLEKGARETFEIQVFDAELSPMEVAAKAGVVSQYVGETEIQDALSAEERSERKGLQFEREQLVLQRNRLRASQAYAIDPKKLEPVYLLKRGNPATPGALVRPGGVEALQGVRADFELDASASDAERRTALAGWITSSKNPLFARVIVNRLWLYHFGVGLVETPSDFGFSGDRPSHPDLLDWLAAELIDRDWDLKAIHRLILNSATYRQSSTHRAAAYAKDADNRLLWRMNPRRLEAEGLRDAMLSVAGLMNEEIGGPGFQDFTTFVHNSQFYSMLDPAGETFHRRSLYRTWVRSGRSPFLDVFDCPDPSATAPKRAVTTTPLQSLTLMNHSFVLRMSDALVDRMKNLKARTIADEVRQVYRWSFGREPSAEAIADAVSLIAEHGRVTFARAIFNSSEFLYVD